VTIFSEDVSLRQSALPKAILAFLRTHRGSVRAHLVAMRTNVAWVLGRPAARPHELAAPLVLSVTSYPLRFKTHALAIKCLLSKTIAANAVLLWIAEAKMCFSGGQMFRKAAATTCRSGT
jgi:hypothetical protein